MTEPLPTVVFVSVPTGIGGSTRSLATVMAHVDGDVHRVLAGPPDGRFVELVRQQQALDTHLPVVSRGRLRPLRRAATAGRLAVYSVRHRRRILAIHANGLKELSMSLPAALLGRVRLVVWVHNFALPPSVRMFGWAWRRLLPHIDVRWAAVSPLARDLVVDAGLATVDAVEIVPNPIDPEDVVAAEVPDAPPDGVAVAYLGAPRRYKGFDLLPDIVAATGPPAHWLLFSQPTDDDLAATWARLRDLAAGGRLSIEGKHPDVRTVYARCDVVVCPSVLESFCRVAAEAMLNGIPVVGSDLPPIRALLGDDEAGLLFTPADTAAAAAAITRLVADADLRRRLGAAGRRRAAVYAPDRVCRQLLAMYGAAGRADEHPPAARSTAPAPTAPPSGP